MRCWAHLAALLVGACVYVPAPVVIPSRVPITPTTKHVAAYLQVVRCGQFEEWAQERPFSRIRFWKAPEADLSAAYDGEPILGLQGGDDIYLADGYEDYDWLIQHEIAHYIIADYLDEDHPPVFDRCNWWEPWA